VWYFIIVQIESARRLSDYEILCLGICSESNMTWHFQPCFKYDQQGMLAQHHGDINKFNKRVVVIISARHKQSVMWFKSWMWFLVRGSILVAAFRTNYKCLIEIFGKSAKTLLQQSSLDVTNTWMSFLLRPASMVLREYSLLPP